MKEPLNPKNNTTFDKILKVTVIISASLVLSIAFLVSFSVISRYFFGKPFAWVIEISEYLLLWSTFVAAAWVLKEDAHIKIDLVINFFSTSTRRSIELGTQILGALLFLAIAVYGFVEAYSFYERGIAAVGMLRVPKYLLLLSIPTGSLLLTVQYFLFIKQRYVERKIKIYNGFL